MNFEEDTLFLRGVALMRIALHLTGVWHRMERAQMENWIRDVEAKLKEAKNGKAESDHCN